MTRSRRNEMWLATFESRFWSRVDVRGLLAMVGVSRLGRVWPRRPRRSRDGKSRRSAHDLGRTERRALGSASLRSAQLLQSPSSVLGDQRTERRRPRATRPQRGAHPSWDSSRSGTSRSRQRERSRETERGGRHPHSYFADASVRRGSRVRHQPNASQVDRSWDDVASPRWRCRVIVNFCNYLDGPAGRWMVPALFAAIALLVSDARARRGGSR